MIYFAEESLDTGLDQRRTAALLDELVSALGLRRKVLIIPPDFTRRHSGAGELTTQLYQRLHTDAYIEILPALGTHGPMTPEEIAAMYPGIPAAAFRTHDWRKDLARLGEAPADFVRGITAGRLAFPVACEVNRLLVEGGWDCILSVGQLVPHEVAGISNHRKNIFVGVGGADAINKTHFIGAACGMEAAMGRTHTPVRAVFDYMAEQFTRHLPIVYLLNVRGGDGTGAAVTRGLYAGDDSECFLCGARLCRHVNLDLLDEPLTKVIVYLDPAVYKSTWLGNKAIYRTRMALADEGELIVLAPGVANFGEDREIDRLIRKHGYHGTSHTLRFVEENPELRANLAAAAHLIHGCSEGRFRVTYCPGGLAREEVEAVGFGYADLAGMRRKYDPAKLRNGWNDVAGERVFFISDPGLGLWALREQFATADSERETERDATDAE